MRSSWQEYEHSEEVSAVSVAPGTVVDMVSTWMILVNLLRSGVSSSSLTFGRGLGGARGEL